MLFIATMFPIASYLTSCNNDDAVEEQEYMLNNISGTVYYHPELERWYIVGWPQPVIDGGPALFTDDLPTDCKKVGQEVYFSGNYLKRPEYSQYFKVYMDCYELDLKYIRKK